MCNAVQYVGNGGTIHVQTNPRSGHLQWGVTMHNPAMRGGVWAYQEFVGGKLVSGDPGKARDILHGSVNPSKAKSGQVFHLEVAYVDPFGFPHHSVPNGCIIP